MIPRDSYEIIDTLIKQGRELGLVQEGQRQGSLLEVAL